MAAALAAAARAATIVTRHYRRGPRVSTKCDGTPVTEADVAAEQAIREELLGAFPEDGFRGEETGCVETRSGRTWIVDPIDGTLSFVRGYPFFSTQIALLAHGELLLGVSSAPGFGEVACAERGRGAYLGGERLGVSRVDTLAAATVSVGNLGGIATDARWQGLGRIAATAQRFRGFGDFYHYHLLAAGRLELVIESGIAIHDIAALAVIVEEAGGRVSDLAGRPITVESTGIVASNGLLHEKALAMLGTAGA